MSSDDGADYEVGYGKPPRDTRFKKGQSGNPKGRPSGKKNLSTVLDDALAEPVVAVVGNGRSKMITKLEAAITQLVNQAASGNLKATQQLLALRLRDTEARADTGPADPPAITEADHQIIQRIQARWRGEKE
jgi:hypothetical protein